MPTKARTQTEQSRMTEQAVEFAALDKELRAIKKRKKELAATLMPLIRKHGAKSNTVFLPDTTRLTIATSTDKRPTLTTLVGYFGKAAEVFWEGLKGKICEYITVHHPGVDDETAED